MKEFRSFAKDINSGTNNAFPTLKEFEKAHVRQEAKRVRKTVSIQERQEEIAPLDLEKNQKDLANKVAENEKRYQDLVEKNRRTKELIKKRDEQKRLKIEKQL